MQFKRDPCRSSGTTSKLKICSLNIFLSTCCGNHPGSQPAAGRSSSHSYCNPLSRSSCLEAWTLERLNTHPKLQNDSAAEPYWGVSKIIPIQFQFCVERTDMKQLTKWIIDDNANDKVAFSHGLPQCVGICELKGGRQREGHKQREGQNSWGTLKWEGVWLFLRPAEGQQAGCNSEEREGSTVWGHWARWGSGHRLGGSC